MPPDTRWLLLWLSAVSVVAGGALGDWVQGSAVSPASLTNSNQDRADDNLNNGTCGYEQLHNQWPMVGGVAFSAAKPAMQGLPMSACGSCWEIQCTSNDMCTSRLDGGSMMVTMVGWCSDCDQHDILLDGTLLAMMADTAAPQIKYRQVECMPPGKIRVVVTEYTMDNSTISLHFTGVGGAGSLQAVQIGHADGEPANSWLTMQNAAGATWTAELMFFGCPPFDLRLTDTFGQTVVLREVIPFQAFVGSAQTGVQFVLRSNITNVGPGSSNPSDTDSMGTADTNSTGTEAGSNPASKADPTTQNSDISGSTALPNQAASPQSAFTDQSNISASHGSNTMRPSLDQEHSMGVATASPPQDQSPVNPALAPAPAVKGTPSGLAPAALSSQTGGTGQMSAAQGQSHAPPQLMPADSAQALGPDSAAPLRLPGIAPALAPASSRAAAADAQAEREKTGSDSLPVIVLGALLGVAIAALLAAVCLLLGLGAFRQRRRPTLVSAETNTEAQPDTHFFAGTHSPDDSLLCLHDNYGGASWKHDTAYQGESRWRRCDEAAQTINAIPSYERLDSGLRQAKTGPSAGYMACTHSLETVSSSAGPGSLAVQQQAAKQPTTWQLEQEGLAVLSVQRLDISQAGLLRLKLFQTGGNLLLQGLQVRQTTEGRVRRGWTALSRLNASTWQLESLFLKPPFDLHVTGSLGETLILRRALTLNQGSDVVIRMNLARSRLQQGGEVLTQRPLAAGPCFFMMKSPEPTEQEILPVPSRTTPAPYSDALLKPRTNVLDSWPSTTSLDGDDSQHGGLSSTYSSLQHYAMENFPSTSSGCIPTPAGMDARASKAASQLPVYKGGMQTTVQKLDFAEVSVTQKKTPRQQPVLSLSELLQHYPRVAAHHIPSGSRCESESVFSESASTLELQTVPCRFGARDFGRVNSLFQGGSQQERHVGWKGEQRVRSCIPADGSSGKSGPRGQYANWARPPDALMGTAFSFQSELLESYAPSLHSGGYSAGSHATVRIRQPGLADGEEYFMDEEQGGSASDFDSTDWPFDGMSCHSPATLQHGDTDNCRHAISSIPGVNAKQYPEQAEIGDSAWETMHHETHMHRCSESSGSTMTYDTSFIKHVGDRLFDSLAK